MSRFCAATRVAWVLGIAGPLNVFPATALMAGVWELEARLGGAHSVPLPIVIRQEGYEELRLTADWRTRAFDPPLYYGWRVTKWRGSEGWAIELVHHKLHLNDPPPEAQSFAISHGYNLITLQRLEARGAWRYGAALGVVAAHPESEIRHRRFEENRGLFGAGYYLSGPTAGLMIGRSHALATRILAMAEGRVTWSTVRAPIADGTARVPNLALHATVGLAWVIPR